MFSLVFKSNYMIQVFLHSKVSTDSGRFGSEVDLVNSLVEGLALDLSKLKLEGGRLARAISALKLHNHLSVTR